MMAKDGTLKLDERVKLQKLVGLAPKRSEEGRIMRNLTFVIVFLSLGLTTGQTTSLIPTADIKSFLEDAAPAVLSLESAFAAIRRSTDPAEVTSLQEAVIDLACQCLSHEDPRVRGIVLDTLNRFNETVDLSGIALCTTDSQMGVENMILARVLDRSRLFFLEEIEKRRILRDCMRDGTTELWMGTVIPAATCMAYAAWDGIPELEAEIQDADSRVVAQTTREWLITVHSVLKGPGSGWDQREDATRRALAIGDTNFGHKLREDASFRTIVLALLELQCTRGKKTSCDKLRSGITSAVRSVIVNQEATHKEEIHWWHCAVYEKGQYTTVNDGPYMTNSTVPVEITDEMIEAAINRQSCDSWSVDRYPAMDADPQSD